MHWSLLLVVACCAARAAAAQEVPAFVCATTEPHPCCAGELSDTLQPSTCVLTAARTSRRTRCGHSAGTETLWCWLQAAVEASYTQFKTAQANQRSAGFAGVTIRSHGT